jgi:subtilisin family serine protease
MKHPLFKISLSFLVILLLYQPTSFDASGLNDVSFKIASYEHLEAGVDYTKDMLNVKVSRDFDEQLLELGIGIVYVETIDSTFTSDYQWLKLKVSSSADWSRVIHKLSLNDDVFFIEPEYIRQPESLVPDASTDPGIINQWYLDFTHTLAAWQYAHNQELPVGGSAHVIVAVIDTGIDLLHPDLNDNIWVNPNEVMDQTDTDGNGYVDDIYGVNLMGTIEDGVLSHHDVTDQHSNGHGTHVSGIIGAVAHNSIGIAGLAFQVSIMPIKATNTSTFTSTNIALGVNYAIAHGAHIINMSFGGSSISQLEADFMYEASKHALLVAAAGNSSRVNEGSLSLPFYPAALPYVLGVMSSRQTPDEQGDYLSSFSNYDRIFNSQSEYELIAPGEQIYSTVNNQTYKTLSGTSMAAPMVSAVAAMMFSMYDDLQPKQVFNHLVQTADLIQGKTLSDGTVLYYRSLNAYQAITTLMLPYEPLQSFEVNTMQVDLAFIDDTHDITMTFKPTHASNTNVSFVSSNPEIASVDQFGVVRARGYGSTTITVTSSENPSLRKTLSVVVGVLRVDSINVSPKAITLESPKEKIQLQWDILPENAINQSVSFKSSNENVATVTNTGIIEAVKEGTATITITSEMDQKVATATVSVIFNTVVKHNITTKVEGIGGSIAAYINNIKQEQTIVAEDQQAIIFKATAQPGYRVYRWLVNGVAVQQRQDELTINADQDLSVAVEFVLIGDLNLDGRVTISDLILLRRFLAQLEQVSTKGVAAADLNHNQAVTISDLITLRRVLAGLE